MLGVLCLLKGLCMLLSERFNEFLMQDQYYFESGVEGELIVALP